MSPFYQLVGFVIGPQGRGLGLGAKLLGHNLDLFDSMGIPTYLEASTPYHGGGVYGKFGYIPVGELMVFTDTAVLYPLWRPYKKDNVNFGGHNWRVLEEQEDKMLLLSENVIELKRYHNTFENTDWTKSDARQYLIGDFYAKFKPDEQSQIIEAFLLSIEEVIKYMGDSGQLKEPISKFFIDDGYNENRKATFDGAPCRWFLRTQGAAPNLVAIVTNEGKISVTGDFVNRASTDLFNVGIRPAMWVKL